MVAPHRVMPTRRSVFSSLASKQILAPHPPVCDRIRLALDCIAADIFVGKRSAPPQRHARNDSNIHFTQPAMPKRARVPLSGCVCCYAPFSVCQSTGSGKTRWPIAFSFPSVRYGYANTQYPLLHKKNSSNTGARTLGLTPCVWRARVRSCA